MADVINAGLWLKKNTKGTPAGFSGVRVLDLQTVMVTEKRVSKNVIIVNLKSAICMLLSTIVQ